MKGNRYVPGNTVRLYGDFFENEVPKDPSSVQVIVRHPDGVRVTYVLGTDPEVQQESTGVYRLDLVADKVGAWWYRWEGVASTKTAFERFFWIIPSSVLAGDPVPTP
jgi:hypothetical protein